MKTQMFILILFTFTGLASQAETIRCFGAMDGVELSGFKVISANAASTILTSKYLSSDVLIQATHETNAASIKIVLIDKASGVSAQAIGWPKADVSLSLPVTQGSTRLIEAVCTYYPQL